ncbi:FixH family protein [Pararhodospirillum oryzae]|uniref:Nitrogen fixation protein FixH n=1 Tax=Pararhodospirillum oryzae TaxID=478448 RepID=A0A512H6Q0_9PROT|nr:FixH family protein [Pararhodospirillum oryzae]GEO81060.1 nitrogen fixation protein FixH [Pararhodospirillum oryzae]
MTVSSAPLAGASSAGAPVRRSLWIPGVLIGAFGIVVAVNMVMLVLAVRTFGGVSTPTAYVEGLAYNHEIATARAEASLGWSAEVQVTPAVSAPGVRGAEGPWPVRIAARVVDASGQPVEGLDVDAVLRRPSDASLDRPLALASLGQGRWQGALDLPAPGLWELRFVARKAEGGVARVRQRVVIDP